MASFEKVDVTLAKAWEAWEEGGSTPEDAGMTVVLRYTAALAAIVAAGFVLGRDEPDAQEASGMVSFADLAGLVALPNVAFIAAGSPRQDHLENAIRDIRARASDPDKLSGPSADGIWYFDVDKGEPAPKKQLTGKNVIVAVIDSGIDYNHPSFMETVDPKKTTRILRIWDQTVFADTIADCPDPDLLDLKHTYGREFIRTEIDLALASGQPLKHVDCVGHGTHVAGCAAGGPRFVKGEGDAKAMGAAPGASLLIVKRLLGETMKVFGTQKVVGSSTWYRDAVTYCLKVAKSLGRPVVINCSFGSNWESGDGLDDDARWTDRMFDPTVKDSFAKGAVMVKSAGNEGSTTVKIGGKDSPLRDKAVITIPPSGEAIVRFELIDTRNGLNTHWSACKRSFFAPEIDIVIWHKAVLPGQMEITIKVPGAKTFGFDPGFGTSWIHAFGGFTASMRRDDFPEILHPGKGKVKRQRILIQVSPKKSKDVALYPSGEFQIRIKGPKGLTLHMLGSRGSWGAGAGVIPQIVPPIDPAVDVTPRYSITDGLGRFAVNVAAYDDADRKTDAATYRAAAGFSSRGPLRDYSDPKAPYGPLAQHPSIAAPGVAILSMASRHTELWTVGTRLAEMGGTSMSSPIVAGVVALMLEKHPDLTVTDAIAALRKSAVKGNGQTTTPPNQDDAFGAGLIDALGAVGLV